MKTKTKAMLVALLVAAACLIGAPTAANAASGATVCNHTSIGAQVITTGGARAFVAGWTCRSGVRQIAPPTGRCYWVTGGTNISWCGPTGLYAHDGRTYYVKQNWAA